MSNNKTYTITVDQETMDVLFGCALNAALYTYHTWCLARDGRLLEQVEHPLPFRVSLCDFDEKKYEDHYEESRRALDFIVEQRKKCRAA